MSDVVAILTDPTESGLKEKTTVLVPRYGAEVAKYDETSERQTHTSTERHRKMSIEIIVNRFGIGTHE